MTESPRRRRPATELVHGGTQRSQWGETSEALFLTRSFVHPDAATAARRFANEEDAFVYSRFSNPTVTMMERRLAEIPTDEWNDIRVDITPREYVLSRVPNKT